MPTIQIKSGKPNAGHTITNSALGALALLVLLLSACSSGSRPPIWVSNNLPPPVVESNTSGTLVPLRVGDSVCIHIIETTAHWFTMQERTELIRTFRERGIDNKTDGCTLTISGTIRFRGWSTAVAADQILAAGYGTTRMPDDALADIDNFGILGLVGAALSGLRAVQAKSANMTLYVAVIDLEAGTYRGRWLAKSQDIPHGARTLYLSEGLALRIVDDLTAK